MKNIKSWEDNKVKLKPIKTRQKMLQMVVIWGSLLVAREMTCLAMDTQYRQMNVRNMSEVKKYYLLTNAKQ